MTLEHGGQHLENQSDSLQVLHVRLADRAGWTGLERVSRLFANVRWHSVFRLNVRVPSPFGHSRSPLDSAAVPRDQPLSWHAGGTAEQVPGGRVRARLCPVPSRCRKAQAAHGHPGRNSSPANGGGTPQAHRLARASSRSEGGPISTAPSGKRAVMWSSPPNALTYFRSVATCTSSRRSIFEIVDCRTPSLSARAT